ncbi:MAG: VWA domain-containing protein [Deltaproteobacteria bacterium]|nr:VWA domain-containing protein [Deltaproteobacteria bacterium]
MVVWLVALLSLSSVFPRLSPAWTAPAAESPAERTLSPYFFIPSGADGVERLPLKSTEVMVDIAGVIADVKVTQVYTNEGQTPIEAIYVFPGSTRAAVYGMKMTIDERVQVAKVAERNAARAQYTEAKAAGKSASLLEQQRPNVFQMNVANIMPGDQIRVELSYTELLVPTEGMYEFVYPTVVGPRYSNLPAATAPPTEQWIANPFLPEKYPQTSTFAIKVQLVAGLPLHSVASASHAVQIAYQSPLQATVSLAPTEQLGGNRDYILRYRLQGDAVESGLLLYEGEDENFFLLMAQPPQRVPAAQIPPRDYVYIIDVSGSMNGFPLDTAKQVMRDLASHLRPTDTLNVLLFSGGSAVLSPRSLPATPENVQQALGFIDREQGAGSTELLPALQRALALPQDERRSRSFVIITDGFVAVETQAFDLIRKNLHNANVFTFGIGSSVNRFLIEGLARAGGGEPFVVTDPYQAPATAQQFAHYIQIPVLTNVAVEYAGFEVYDVEPVSIPDVLAERPVLVFGKWRGRPHGAVTIHGTHGAGVYSQTSDVAHVTPLPTNSALRYLWARHRIAMLGDYQTLDPQDELVKEITTLGLTYNLLTAYTSFLAVDEVVRNVDGQNTSVKQPLPLPQGVTNLAVGGAVPTVPEPETYALMGIVGLLLFWMWTQRRESVS